MEKEKKKPELVLRAGDVKVVLWSNDFEIKGEIKTQNSFNLERIYKDKDGNWNSTSSFNLNDIDKLIYLLNGLKSRMMPIREDKRE